MPQRALEELIPVTVITGFLGSGKTTVLSYLLGQPAFANTAVVINEFGEISLDHALVRKTSEDIVELERLSVTTLPIDNDLNFSVR